MKKAFFLTAVLCLMGADKTYASGSTLTVEEPIVKPGGVVSSRQVMDLVLNHTGELGRCQRLARISTGRISGSITFVFKIEKKLGTVEKLAVKSNTTGDSSLADCIGEKIEKWTFPRPKEPIDIFVELPLRFTPN